jgi:hypothetical protein
MTDNRDRLIDSALLAVVVLGAIVLSGTVFAMLFYH